MVCSYCIHIVFVCARMCAREAASRSTADGQQLLQDQDTVRLSCQLVRPNVLRSCVEAILMTIAVSMVFLLQEVG